MKKKTRELLLDSAFKSFYKNGFQGANIAEILKEIGINKGSMYHFFKSKKLLALAVIEERIKINLLKKYNNILNFEMLFNTFFDAPKNLIYGCPLNKMSQEMLYIDNDFKRILSQVYKEFENSVNSILHKSLKQKYLSTYDTIGTSQLIIATYEGALMIYHLNQNLQQYKNIIQNLKIRLLNDFE